MEDDTHPSIFNHNIDTSMQREFECLNDILRRLYHYLQNALEHVTQLSWTDKLT